LNLILPISGEVIMSKIIVFHVPTSFRKKATKRISSELYGKLIPFGLPQKKSA